MTNFFACIFQKNHVPDQITDANLAAVAKSISIDEFKTILKPILRERIVGSAAHEEVRNVRFPLAICLEQ